MTTLNTAKSTIWHGARSLIRLQALWIVLVVVGLGILLGKSINSTEQGELVASIVIVIATLALSLYKPLATVMVWVFFFPFLETIIKIPLGANIPDLSFSRFTIAFLAIAMLAKATIGLLKIKRIGAVEILTIVSTLGIALSAPLSVNPTGVYQTALAWYFTPFIAYFFAKNLITKRSDIYAIFWAIAFLGTVSAIYAAFEHATGTILFLPRGKTADDLMLVREESGIRLIVGIWGSAGAMGRALAMCIPVTLHLFLENNARRARKLLLAGMLAIQCYSIVITMTRAPWLSLLIALFFMQLFDKRFRRLFIIIAIISAIMLGLTWERVSQSTVATRLNDETSTVEGRQARWNAGWNMWLARPIRGWGVGRFEQQSWRFRTDGGNARLNAPENDYLVVMISSGLLGLLPYLGVILIPLVDGLRLIAQARSFQRQDLPWPGFVKVETLAVACAVTICFLVYSFSAANVIAGTKLILLVITGTVIGSHEHLLRSPKRRTATGQSDRTPPGDAVPSLATQRLNT